MMENSITARPKTEGGTEVPQETLSNEAWRVYLRSLKEHLVEALNHADSNFRCAELEELSSDVMRGAIAKRVGLVTGMPPNKIKAWLDIGSEAEEVG